MNASYLDYQCKDSKKLLSKIRDGASHSSPQIPLCKEIVMISKINKQSTSIVIPQIGENTSRNVMHSKLTRTYRASF